MAHRRVFIEELRALGALVYDFSRFSRTLCLFDIADGNSKKIDLTSTTQTTKKIQSKFQDD